jgi:putative tryptophan/tyrosine transport system substrate-binding protein
MRRREFITLIGTAVAWPRAARAQTMMPTIGILNSRAPGESSRLLEAFRQGLKETGFAEGQNVRIEYRFAHNQNGRLPELATDLVQRQATVIVSMAGTPGALAAKSATKVIPIVFQRGRPGCCRTCHQPKSPRGQPDRRESASLINFWKTN